MTELLFRGNAYLRLCEARVVAAAPGAIVLDRTVFYAAGGGQPGDSGVLRLADGSAIAILVRSRARAPTRRTSSMFRRRMLRCPLPAPRSSPRSTGSGAIG